MLTLYLFLSYLYQCFAFVYVCIPWASRGQKSVPELLELKLQKIASHSVGARNQTCVL